MPFAPRTLVLIAGCAATLLVPALLARDGRLRAAVRRGDEREARLLLTLGANPSSGDSNGDSSLELAVKSGDAPTLTTVLKARPNVNAFSAPKPALHLAAANGDVDLVKRLLDLGADVNLRTEDRATALHEASRFGRFEVARVLLDRGGAANARTRTGRSALMDAARLEPEDGVQAACDKQAIVLLLLDAAAQVQIASDTGRTPLMEAADTGNVGAAQLLIAMGANVNGVDAEGRSVLMIAEAAARPPRGLHLALGPDSSLEMVALLEQSGAVRNPLAMQVAPPRDSTAPLPKRMGP